MRVFLTGNEGYLGLWVADALLAAGHDVVGLDTGFYKNGWLCTGPTRAPLTLARDTRSVTPADLTGFDAVVHLAELSNDPLGEFDPGLTHEVNHRGSLGLARAAKRAGVTRFVYMSSCSVYGVATGGDVTEDQPVNPQTAYAVCKTLVERDVSAIAGDDFSPTFLRNATAFGLSPRMRFDLVVNNLSGLAWTTGKVAMSSDGTPWRPLVHARDIASAIVCVLAADRAVVHDQILNVGDSRQNYRVSEVADAVAAVFTGCEITYGTQGADNRSYRVNFDKIADLLPDFRCDYDLKRGVDEIHAALAQVALTTEQFQSSAYTRLARLRELVGTGQLDRSLRWVAR